MTSLINVDRRRLGGQDTFIEEYRGISTDTKPILLANRNGSVFYEMDTKKAWLWDGENLKWLPQ